jgi:hypothetical protein
MNRKLHRVEVVLYVIAEDEFDACWAATNARFDVFECMAEEAKTIDPGWENAVPYNAEDDRTCSEIFTSKMQRAGYPEDKSIQLPSPWATNAGVLPMKNSPRKQTSGFGTGLQMIRNFINRLFDQTEQNMNDAGVNRRFVP